MFFFVGSLSTRLCRPRTTSHMFLYSLKYILWRNICRFFLQWKKLDQYRITGERIIHWMLVHKVQDLTLLINSMLHFLKTIVQYYKLGILTFKIYSSTRVDHSINIWNLIFNLFYMYSPLQLWWLNSIGTKIF